VPDHPRLTDGERGEHPDHVQLDEPGYLGVEHHDQTPGEQGQHHHPVGEHQPVAAVAELPGQEPVVAEDRREERETLVGGVGGEDQDQRGEHLEQPEPQPATEHRPPHLGEHRAVEVDGLVGDPDPGEPGQGGDPEEQ